MALVAIDQLIVVILSLSIYLVSIRRWLSSQHEVASIDCVAYRRYRPHPVFRHRYPMEPCVRCRSTQRGYECAPTMYRTCCGTKAMQAGKTRTAHKLQWLLTHSWHAKLLAVRRVGTNDGKNTPGVDGVLWTTQEAKLQAACDLHRRGSRSLPLRRIHIPKGKGKLRPLGNPNRKVRGWANFHRHICAKRTLFHVRV